MKIATILFALTVFTLTGCKSQDPAVKAANEAEQQAWFAKAVQALNDREFVLEADQVTFKRGNFVYVNGSTNFVSLHKDRATIQLAFNSPYAGPNGIGGITVDGSVSNIKTSTDKKRNLIFSMSVTGVGVSARVVIQMVNGTNKCSATVYPNFSSNVITFSGNLYAEEDSNVFKGRSL
ncbi:hypothetical protein FACS1894179_01720 [Bacteroidia bacterium]|nr:hypothetical protein FACS1894169_03040 [Bacteroidia bacterium]GHV38387.1 hypothetical protein FACS1894179_01720 [Bacteroidia bacterium]